ncbi:MAG TPA: STN domain-containing protein, partial [Pedobacter sp.]
MKIILPFSHFFSQLFVQKKIIKLAIAGSMAFILPAANVNAQVGQIKTEQRIIKNDQSVLDRKISVNIQNETLQNALNQIAGKAGISFSYDSRSIAIYTHIHLSASNQKLSEVLDELLKPYRLSFTVVGKSVIISRKIAAPVPVSGKGTAILPISGRVI